MLTIRQVDNVVQSNLFVIKGWEHERQEQGATILYAVWINATSPKLYLGIFRVWEGLDGDGRCGWQPLSEITPEQEKLRDFFHLEVVMPILVKANKATDNQSAAQPASIDKENITIGELDSLLEKGDKEAVEFWKKEVMPELEELRKALIGATEKTFENDHAKPLFELLKSMYSSKNPVHRAFAKPYGNWTLGKLKKDGAKTLADELSKSANELPAPIDAEQVIEPPKPALPEIEDPTNQRIWRWIKESPSITDTDIAQKLNVSRQTINTRRRILISMGYPAKRKVSRQKR